MIIQNGTDRTVMFKMKTTRPTIYKMKPVFGQVLPGEKFSVRLVYKGIKVGDRIPLNDSAKGAESLKTTKRRLSPEERVRQGDSISPKLFSATLEDVKRELEWEDMGVKVDGRQLHHLRFADDVVLITPSIIQAERTLCMWEHWTAAESYEDDVHEERTSF
ncbi:unnamed protein product [Heligmosomoides polygyrus]|uniref:Major sperm protein n=1 Tax=Heligmosomoides polygyrus TaxID=6339 RepID=A0A3P8CP99_HELPZ|nr:unnamed protein product [Heligmosomoides polygyrus]